MKEFISKHKKPLAGGAGALLLIIAVAVWMRPTAVLDDAVEKLATATSHRFELMASLENDTRTNELIGESATIEIQAKGAFTKSKQAQESLQSDILITAKTEGLTIEIEGEVRLTADKIYILIKKAPPTIPILTTFKDTWVELPRRTAERASSLDSQQQLFSSVSRSGSKEVAGQRATTYQVEATSDAALQLMDGIIDLLGARLTQAQVADYRDSVAASSTIPATIAVKKFSREISQITTAVNLPGGTNKLNLELTLTDRNRPVTIEAPENPQTLQQLIEQQPAQ